VYTFTRVPLRGRRACVPACNALIVTAALVAALAAALARRLWLCSAASACELSYVAGVVVTAQQRARAHTAQLASVGHDIAVPLATLARPRHVGLWLAQQGLSTDGGGWDQHDIRCGDHRCSCIGCALER
jgi:hypothetical protein